MKTEMNWYFITGLIMWSLFLVVVLAVGFFFMPQDTEPVVSVSDNVTMAYQKYVEAGGTPVPYKVDKFVIDEFTVIEYVD